jgi:hypothetical protein
MSNKAVVKGLNPNVESEVNLNIGGILISGYIPFGVPFQLELEKEYTVEIGVTILDDLEMVEISEMKMGIEQVNNTFVHNLHGKFNAEEKTIDVGFEVKLDEDIEDFLYLDGKYVEVKVDRIKVNFS